MTESELDEFQSDSSPRLRITSWRQRQGTIYLLQVIENGPIKIGFTDRDPSLRAEAMQQSSPYELLFIGSFSARGHEEKEIHDILAAHRVRGEWFHPSEEVLALLRSRCPELDENRSGNGDRQLKLLKKVHDTIGKSAMRRGLFYRCLERRGINVAQFRFWARFMNAPSPEMVKKTQTALTEFRRKWGAAA